MRQRICPIRERVFIFKASTTEDPPKNKKSWWEEFTSMFFDIIPSAMRVPAPDNDGLKNYANIKEGVFSKHKANSKWSNDDIIENFASHYIPDYRKSSKTQKLFDKLGDLDEMELLDSLDEYSVMLDQVKNVDAVTGNSNLYIITIFITTDTITTITSL